MRTQPVILVGVGGVGRCLIKLIESSKKTLEGQGIRLSITALCDSSGCVHKSGAALDDALILECVTAKEARSSLLSVAGSSPCSALEVVKSWGQGAIVVDCSASDDVLPALLLAVEQGGGACMANKKPLTAGQAEFDRLFSAQTNARVGYESTVGAGTPMVAALQRVIAGGDQVKRIHGTFSGTLGYLMTGLDEGKSFSEVVQTAFDLGYTEPDPRDDLGGVDVARKALILARTLGWKMTMEDVAVESLYPADYGKLDVKEFLAALGKLNESFQAKSAAAEKEGKCLRFTASIEGGKCEVGLKAVSKDSPIGRLSGTANMIEIYTEIYGDAPLVIQGAGAGGDVTAAGVLADIVKVTNAIQSLGAVSEPSAKKARTSA